MNLLVSSRKPLKNDMELNEAKFILQNNDLAKLGDAYVNFIFSVAITEVKQKPVGIKVSDRVLAEAAKRSGLRKILPKRIDRGQIGDAVEAIIVYTWLKKIINLEDAVNILKNTIDDPSQAFANLITEALNRINKQ